MNLDFESKEKIKKPVLLFLVGGIHIFYHLLINLLCLILIFSTSLTGHLISIPFIDVITEEYLHGNSFFMVIKLILHSLCIFFIVGILRSVKRYVLYLIFCQAVIVFLPFVFLTTLGIEYLLMSQAVSIIFALFFILIYIYFGMNRFGKIKEGNNKP